MKNFEHARAASFTEAGELLQSEINATVMAGGTDLLSVIKNEILEESPSLVIDIKRIDGADKIEFDGTRIKIGANTKLSEIAEDETVIAKAPALAEAAHSVATPLVRNLATVGGNLCQDVRCWFYRYPHEAGDRIDCRRKGGDDCYAVQGDNRYHSVYGGLSCGLSPCTQGCPAATDIPGYMAQLREGNVAGAAQIILKSNPMPALTSRVCAHFCQDGCNQSGHGDSVAARNVERFVGDYALRHRELFYRAPAESTGKRVAVVGSGPAGLSAAYYLRLEGNGVTVYDSKEEPGGMLMYAVPDYRLPKAIVRDYTAALEGMGIEFVCSKEVGKDITPGELEESFDSVYYATGTWKRPVLGLSGEELTVFGLDFLVQVHDWMGGKVGKEVLVTGGGNVAMDVAVTAKRLGAEKVTLACLETEDIMPAGKEEVARAREEGIELMPGWGLSKVLSEGGSVQGMELVRCVSVYDENRRFNPVYDESEKREVKAENILMAVGQKADLSFLDEGYRLQLDERGLIDAEADSRMTSRAGVFAGGDATSGPSTVIQCAADGRSAAKGISRYLGLDTAHECNGMQSEKRFLSFDAEGVRQPEGLKLKEIPAEQRGIEVEDEIAPGEAEALAEAVRCMNCGCYSVAPSDIAPVLVALGATIKTTKKEYAAETFCCTELSPSDVLSPGELVTGLSVPVLEGAVMHYDKFRLREALDWAIVGLASVFAVDAGKITASKLVLGGVAPIPLRLNEVEGFLLGRELDGKTIKEAADLAVKDCMPMWNNRYKVQIIKAMISKALERLQ